MRLSTYMGLLILATIFAAFAHADSPGRNQSQAEPPQYYPVPQEQVPVPVAYCSLVPLGGGMVAIIQNDQIELYRGFAATVQTVLIHYQRLGACPQIF